MKAKLIQIGNSRGIRIPKPVLEQCGLDEEVVLEVKDRRLVISAPASTREGWDSLFEQMAEYGDDRLLDSDASTSAWDAEEWEWS